MPYTFQLGPKYLIALGLLCINLVHVMIATYFQIPGNFVDETFREYIFLTNTMYYGIGILSTFFYPVIARKCGLKFTLMMAILFDMIGLSALWLSILMGGNLPLIFISTIFWGLSLLTVTISIISYLVIAFPKKLGVSLMILFAFGEAGAIIADLLFNAFSSLQFNEGFFFLSLISLSALIYFVFTKFKEPNYPKHLRHLRKGGLIWSEFHYRLIFFMIAAIGYGLIESVFSIWGETYLIQFMPETVVLSTISIFWFCMLIGQILLLLPLYFYPMRQILPLLIIALVLTLIFIQKQTGNAGLITGFGIAGFICAAILPIIMASMENELISASFLTHHQNYLPYVEIGTALLIGSYYFGIGVIDLYVLGIDRAKEFHPQNFFHWAVIITALMGLITMFLNWSSSYADEK